MGSTDVSTTGLDEVQVKLLEEECILVSENDASAGSASKKDCHLWSHISKGTVKFYCNFKSNSVVQILL